MKTEILEYLMEISEVNKQDIFGNSPLHMICENKKINTEIIKIFSEKKANFNIKNK